jgi:ankyrin repeat protein
MHAAANGHYTVVSYLYQYGANINAAVPAKPEMTAIFLAAQGNQYAAVDFLISVGQT